MVSSLWGLELNSFQGVQPGTPPPLWMSSGFSWTHSKWRSIWQEWPIPIRLMRLYRFVLIYLAQVSINHETRQTTIRAWDPKLTPPPTLPCFEIFIKLPWYLATGAAEIPHAVPSAARCSARRACPPRPGSGPRPCGSHGSAARCWESPPREAVGHCGTHDLSGTTRCQ